MGPWPLLQCMFSNVQLVEIGEAEQSTAPDPPGWGLSMGPIIPCPPHRTGHGYENQKHSSAYYGLTALQVQPYDNHIYV